MKRACGTIRKDLQLVQKEDAKAPCFTSPPGGASPDAPFPSVRRLLQQQRAEKIPAPVLQRPLPAPPPRQVPALTGGPAPTETYPSAKQAPSAYRGGPGSAQEGPPAAGVPPAAAAAVLPGTRQPGNPAPARSLSRPDSARLPRRHLAPRAGPCASSPPAQLPWGPGASPPAEPWGRFTHPGRRLAPHRAGEPSLRRPGPHRASPAMARAPEGGSAGRRHLLARPAAPGAGSGGRGFTRAGAGAAWSLGGRRPGFPRCCRRAPAVRVGRARAGPPPAGSSYWLRGRGCKERGLAAAERARDPPSHRPARPLRPALLARWLARARFRHRLPGRQAVLLQLGAAPH